MSNCVAFQTQLASIMELLVQAAVAEMGNLVDEDTAIVLRLEVAGQQTDNEVLKQRIQTQNELMTSRFASIMGMLSKEALDKITKLVDETKQQLMELELMTAEDTEQESCLNGLTVAECVEEHTGVKEEDNSVHLVLKAQSVDLEEDSPESPLCREESLEYDSDTTEPQQGLKCTAEKAVWATSDFGRGFYNDHQYWEENDNVEAPDDQHATEKFQALGKVYAVLSDKEQRAVYDEQGTVDEECDSLGQDRNWEEYWRLLFPKITLEDILQFERKYKGTDEESEDVRRLYVQFEGDMDLILASALCCSQEDEPRIASIIQDGIDSGELTPYRAFTHESKQKKSARKRKANKEQKEAEEMKKEMGLDADDSLVAMLQQRQKSREQGFNSFLSDLEAKYSKKGKATSGKKGKK
ncbi:hypothetical protein COCON_G00036360 [Conger conger]|uniref:DNAJC9 HTH domain-containing protein n=1 Tax=Conger conger TaxID=82655 RepID=A0A9Q1DZL9_CONCO|nr:hypothetical protein COCON_G00036360 [Conger conger]